MKGKWPHADGTFIQKELVKEWDDRKWLLEFKYLKEIGMHYIVLAPTGFSDKDKGDSIVRTIYPTNIDSFKMYEGYGDIVDICLRNAQQSGIKVFIGLNMDDFWWRGPASNPQYIYDRMGEGNLIADELYKKYYEKYRDVFYGWYWVWEIENLSFKRQSEWAILARAMNINLKHLKSYDNKLPIMLCPFMNCKCSSIDFYKRMWIYLLSHTDLGQGDIICPQDSIGAGWLTMDVLKQWFKAFKEAVDTKPGVAFWCDTETFCQADWTSATINRFVKQMKEVKEYVDNIITFSYSHYYSPNIINDGFHKAYRTYLKTGVLNKIPPKPPYGLNTERLDNGNVMLSWNPPDNASDICGYHVYRGDNLIANIQVPKRNKADDRSICSTSFVIADHSPNDTYRVKSYDFCGNVSE